MVVPKPKGGINAMRKESTVYRIISKLPTHRGRAVLSARAWPARVVCVDRYTWQKSRCNNKAARRPHDYGTAASSGSRLRLETTTPPGCSTVIANAVARLTRRRGSILTKTSPAADVTSNTPPSTG